jgi:hypothetical protein
VALGEAILPDDEPAAPAGSELEPAEARPEAFALLAGATCDERGISVSPRFDLRPVRASRCMRGVSLNGNNTVGIDHRGRLDGSASGARADGSHPLPTASRAKLSLSESRSERSCRRGKARANATVLTLPAPDF